MKVYTLLEGIGKNDYHNEAYFAPMVAEFVRDEGVAYWPDIMAYVELNTDLTGVDLANPPGSNVPRWKKTVANLHAHRTLEGRKYQDIIRIKGGFATRDGAAEQGIQELPGNSQQPKEVGKRGLVDIKKQVGVIANTAYKNLGRPKLSDKYDTRRQIERMVKNDPWLPEPELIKKAEEIISTNR